MTTIEAIAEFIGPFEGCHRVGKDTLVYPYICPAGYATQGYGLLVKDMSVTPITKDEALARFMRVIPLYIAHAYRLSPILASNQKELIAITSFIFNLGATAYAGSTLRKKVNAGDWEAAAEQIVRWNKGGGRVLQGLVKRRAAEAALLLGT